MKVQLLVSEWCASCHQAERVWREVAEERAIDFAVVDMGQPEGKALVSELRLKTIPALVIDRELKAVGVQTKSEALALVGDAPTRQASAVRHVGLGMERSSRIAVLASMGYLFLAGAALPVYGGFFADGPARVAPLHVLTLGFLVFLIYGLAEHMLPRFTGNPIRLGPWPWVQQGLSHLGLWLFFVGFWWQLHAVLVTGALLAWSGLALFAFRIWPVLWPTLWPGGREGGPGELKGIGVQTEPPRS
ncbi:MAG: thioredoxin family protein [Gammaproteobacteria bacterium]